MSIGGKMSVADVQDLLANWDPRIAALASQYAAAAPAWAARDPVGAGNFGTALSALQDRYAAARSSAESTISLASDTSFIVPLSYSPAQSTYDAILKAVRQNYPPDGATIVPGDYDELLQRLQAAVGATLPQPTVQPVAEDPDLEALKATQPLDVIGKLTGQIAPNPATPTTKLGWAVVAAGAVLGAGLLGSLGMPGILVGAAIGGGLTYEAKQKILSILPSWPTWL